MALDLLQATEFGLHFRWRKPNGGFRWDNKVTYPPAWKSEWNHSGPFLVEHPSSTEMERVTSLPSFETFAALISTPEAILSFANQYGWLGIGEPVTGGARAASPLVGGESLQRWKQEIRAMRTATDLWRGMETYDGKRFLGQVIQGDPKKQAIFLRMYPWGIGKRPENAVSQHQYTSVIAASSTKQSPGIHPELYSVLWKQVERGHYNAAANLAIISIINERLRGMASPGLLLNESLSLEQHVQPHHLLGYLWLQLYCSVLGLSRLKRPCIYCGDWLDITDAQRRSKAAHQKCIDRAKSRRSYQRKAQLYDIARQLKKWNLSPVRRDQLLKRRKQILDKRWARSTD